MTQSKQIGSWLYFTYIARKTDLIGLCVGHQAPIKRLSVKVILQTLAMTNLKTLMNRFFNIKVKTNGFLGDIDNIVTLGQLLI